MVESAGQVPQYTDAGEGGSVEETATAPTASDHLTGIASGYATPPRTPYEQAIHAIWSSALGHSAFGIHDDFFELGGHSMLAPKIVSQVRRTLGVDVSVRDFFSQRTIAAISAVVSASSSRQPKQIGRRPDGERPVLSFDQQRLWLESQLVPDLAYNVHGRHRLYGPLDLPVLEASLRGILARHESLRTRFPVVDGTPVPVVDDIAHSWDLPVIDVSNEANPAMAANRVAEEQATKAFDLAEGPLFSCLVARLSPTDHLLAITAHHIVCDDWSVGLFSRELSQLYEAGGAAAKANLADLAIQYGDYAWWQRQNLSGENLERVIAYWRHHLDQAPTALNMPSAKRRSAIRRAGEVIDTTFSESQTAAIHKLGRAHGATPFMVVYATLATLLGRWSGQSDIVIGVPVAGRTDVGTESLIGFLVNMLPIRLDLRGSPTFNELLIRTRQACLDGYAHSDAPFDLLIKQLDLPRDPRHPPLVQVMLNVMDHPAGGRQMFGGLDAAHVDPETALPSKFDLGVNMTQVQRGLRIQLDHNPDRYPADLLRHFLGQFTYLLDRILANPDQPVLELDLNPQPDKPNNSTAHVVARPRTAEARKVATSRTALRTPTGSASFAWLVQAASRAGAHSSPARLTTESDQPSIERAAALLARVTTSSAPSPAAHRTAAQTVNTAASPSATVPADSGAEEGLGEIQLPDELAELGSWWRARWELDDSDRFAAPTRDSNILGTAIATAVAVDGEIVLPEAAVHRDPWPWLRAQQISVAFLTTAQVRSIAAPVPHLRHAFIEHDGELLPQDIVALQAHAPGCRVVAMYRFGPDGRPAAHYEPPADWQLSSTPLRVPLGLPASPGSVSLLTQTGSPAAVGEVGELEVHSTLTGDLARRWPDGVMEYVGSSATDPAHDVVHTLAELRDLPAVQDALVTRLASEELVAYVSGPTRDDAQSLRRALSLQLPEWLIPDHVQVLDRIPLDDAGRYDPTSLPTFEPPAHVDGYTAPRTPMEEELTTIFQDLLEIDHVGIHDTFFDLNGFSLLATQLAARIRESFQVDLPLREIFESPTVAGLAEVILHEQSERVNKGDLEELLSKVESAAGDQ